jgi:hypothetical protein
MLMDARGEGDEAERFAVLLDLAEAGAQVTEAPASIASDVPPKAAE